MDQNNNILGQISSISNKIFNLNIELERLIFDHKTELLDALLAQFPEEKAKHIDRIMLSTVTKQPQITTYSYLTKRDYKFINGKWTIPTINR